MLRVNDGDSRVSDEKGERFSGDYFVKKKTGVFPADKLLCLLVSLATLCCLLLLFAMVARTGNIFGRY